jgi:hypothetical protein
MSAEATEIQVFGMTTNGKTGDSRIAQRGEVVEYYDILVRGDPDEETGEIPEIEEFEDLTYLQMVEKVAELERKYDLCSEEVWGF